MAAWFACGFGVNGGPPDSSEGNWAARAGRGQLDVPQAGTLALGRLLLPVAVQVCDVALQGVAALQLGPVHRRGFGDPGIAATRSRQTALFRARQAWVRLYVLAGNSPVSVAVTSQLPTAQVCCVHGAREAVMRALLVEITRRWPGIAEGSGRADGGFL
jgi:hypothetical protein